MTSKVEPNSFFCPEHQVNHKRGSAVYYKCLETYFDSAPEEVEVEEVAKAEKIPVVVERAGMKFFFKLKEGEVFCVLTNEAPDQITVASGMYKSGVRVFSRKAEPFIVTRLEFERVLDRGAGYFEMLTERK